MRRFSLLAVVALLVAACTQEIVVETIPAIADDAPETITVGFENEDTRIQLNEAQKTVWTNGDQVSVFYRSDANQKWEYNGPTGSRTADIYRVEAGQHTQKLPKVVVVYPYNENYYINPETCDIQAFMPAEQTYMKDSYGLDGNIMISAGYYNQFSLKNVCGWLKVQLEGNGEMIKSITLRGNNGEQVAGEIYINSADASSALASEMGEITDEGDGMTGGAGGNLVFEDTVIKEVTLDCGNGVELGAEATAFYIALPPQTFANGLTITVTAVDGTEMIKSTSNEIVIERNHIQPMAALEYDGIPNNEIWYTSTDDSVVEPNATNVFGANILSNTYENGKGVIVFDGPVTKIGYEAFEDCDKLTSVTIPNGVTEVGNNAFYACSKLTSFTIPHSVTTIGKSAFSFCIKLTSISIPNSVTTIEEEAFYRCYKLTSITIPDSVTTIGESAFLWCSSITSVTIPDSVTSIGPNPFQCCPKLREFKGKYSADGGRCLIKDNTIIAYADGSGSTYTIPDSVATIGEYAFFNCASLTSVTIPDSVTTIGVSAFYGCDNLTSVSIGNSVTTIGTRAFYRCPELAVFKGKYSADGGRCLIKDNTIIAYAEGSGTTYTIPDSVTTIGEYAFGDCDILTSITIPDSVTTIGESTFYSCGSLKYVYCKPTTPPTLNSSSVFSYNASGRKIYVPVGSGDAYKGASRWSNYSADIVETTF